MNLVTKMKRAAVLTAAILVASSTVGLPADYRYVSAAETTAAVNSVDAFRIVALGDSITAGYEPGMTESSIPYGFVERLWEQGLYHSRTEVVNYGILGLKSEGLVNLVNAIADARAVTGDQIQSGLVDPRIAALGSATPQMKTDLAAADVVTITIGGNDLKDVMFSAISSDTVNKDAVVSQAKTLLTAYTANVKKVVEKLHAINPEATIIIADQYQPVPQIASSTGYPILLQISSEFTSQVDQLVAAFSAQGVKVKSAHVAEQFIGGEGTMTHIIGSRDIHPNQIGYTSIAEVFANTIWGEYKQTPVNTAPAPMGVIVKGQLMETPYQPILRNNQNYVAIKEIVDAMGAKTAWDNKTSSATITYGDKQVVITIGAKSVNVNGESIAIDSPAFLEKVGKESKTYVPLAALAKGLGFDVQYNTKTRTVFINP